MLLEDSLVWISTTMGMPSRASLQPQSLCPTCFLFIEGGVVPLTLGLSPPP
uniref:Uncharacterized protein n=1 Tax=Utricularia reniformis TaxID=192314 RepID=A0A1Y0B0C5_9LAMI|nr:hypothetical protein AEK19_MT0627 [Utricularia reniformis]ART30882.1 hypothetical protein AEK19_MT0627 [Utricularia reniformis]